jgi:hypothetical protein
MIHLFIDTNRYLALYGFPRNKLKEIGKLIELIKEKKILLYVPEQVENEVTRKREEYLIGISKRIEKLNLSTKEENLSLIPECEDQLKRIQELHQKNQTEIKSLIESMKIEFNNKIKKKTFQVDGFINTLFSLAIRIPYEAEIINKAYIRYDLGNPPGKNGSYGDAVIWESLLKAFPNKENLFFVGFDNDFNSKLNDKEFSPFLLAEWRSKKKSDIRPFKNLGDFVKDQIPEIKKSDEILEKENQINNEYLLSSNALKSAMENMVELTNKTEVARDVILSNSKVWDRIRNTTLDREQIELASRVLKQLNESIGYPWIEKTEQQKKKENKKNEEK